MEKQRIEIMAPVGSYESLHAAIQGGATSVYFGVGQLNMRAHSSNNFTLEDISKIVNIAKDNGVRTYVTINTIVFDEEMEKLYRLIDTVKECGASAIIASDISVIQYAFNHDVEVHISTQLNITNIEAVKFYAHYADVMVLAREMTMDKVKKIHDQIIEQDICGPKGERIKLEMFVHGALCMAVSGKCYMSLHEMNASANRGNCMQICRRSYIVKDRDTGEELAIDNEYIMSPKDLKTIHFLNKILDSGVSILKIEGRARSAEYVKTVVKCYSEAVMACQDNNFTEEKIKDWNKRLSSVFNRGFWNGYYLGQRLGEWSKNYGSSATEHKVYIGRGTNYFSKLQVAEFKMETGNLCVGDRIMIIGPTTGVIEKTVKGIRVDLKIVDETKKGDSFSLFIEEKIRKSDKLYKIVKSEKKSFFNP